MDQHTCKHFNSIRNDCCRAGVRYHDVTPLPNAPGSFYRMPCQKPEGYHSAVMRAKAATYKKGTCSSFQLPSAEELAEDEEQTRQCMERSRQIPLIVGRLKTEHAGQSWRGVWDCPCCGGRLHLSISSNSRQHTAGKCETPNCLNWIE